jgi:hypothetical protein
MIIGIAGAKHSGKNTLAEYISDHFEGDFLVKEWSFAADLKRSAAKALGFEGEHEEVFFCDDLKEAGTITISFDNEKLAPNSFEGWSISGREFLQLYGTEAHRDIFGPNFWVNNLFDKIYADEDGQLIHTADTRPRFDLITDVRFPNEADAIRSNDGKVIQIRRTEVERGDSHSSEKPLDTSLIDATIWNDLGLDQFRVTGINTVREICRSYISSSLARKVPYA